MTPKISVIIPLYNKAPYIKRAIDSVLAQTIQDFEIIIVNDGSTDGSEKIIEEYSDSRIHLINQENQGVSAARNHGVDVAQANLVAFLDADDEWLPEFLDVILKMRDIWPDAGLYGTKWYECSSENHRLKISTTIKFSYKLISSPFKYMVENGDFPISSSTVAIPKSTIEKVGYFKVGVPFAEDHEYWARIALYYPFACNITPSAVVYKNIPDSACQKYRLCEYHPFQDTLNSLPVTTLQKYRYKHDLDLYIEFLNFGWALDASSRNKRKLALSLLNRISAPEFRIKKIMYIGFVLLPTPIQSFIIKIRTKLA